MTRSLRVISRTLSSSSAASRTPRSSLQELLDRADSEPDSDTRCDLYARAIRQCSSSSSKSEFDARRLRQRLIERGYYGRERLLMNLLIEMHGKLGDLAQAMHAFASIPNPNAFSWTILIVAFAQNGELLQAINLFRRMELEGVRPTLVTCASVIAVCASLGRLKQGQEMHHRLIQCGFMLNSVVENSLVNLYGKCGLLDQARGVFDEMFDRDVIAWTSLVSAYVLHGQFRLGLITFHEMNSEGVKPNDLTFSSVLEACGSSGDLPCGRRVHSQITQWGNCVSNGAELITMYGKCGSVRDAEYVLETVRDEADLNMYNAMLLVYSQFGLGNQALRLLSLMKERKVAPDEVTYTILFSSLTNGGEESFAAGKKIYHEILTGSDENQMGVVLQTAVIKMYLTNSRFDEAAEIFNRMKRTDMFVWTLMITAFTERGEAREALRLFHRTRLEGLGMNKAAATSALDACATIGAFKQGRQIHAMVCHLGYEPDAVLGSVLVNLYWRSGCLHTARWIFDGVVLKDVICWNAMLSGYAYHGLHGQAVDLMREAALDGVRLSEITFQCVLFACSHRGKLEEGWRHFLSMVGDHAIAPTDEHYRCIIDLLGRAGHLQQAEELINAMPVEPAKVAWTMLLGACKVHKDMVRGNRIAKLVCGDHLEENTSPYVLLSSIYSDSDVKWNMPP